jgi:hypothetical protein
MTEYPIQLPKGASLTFQPMLDGSEIYDSVHYHPPIVGQQGEFCGKTWRQMPGAGNLEKKLNFFLFRRGLYEPTTDSQGRVQINRVFGGGRSR